MTTDTPPSANSPGTSQADTPLPRPPSRARRLGWPLLLLVLITASIALVAYAWNISRAQRDEAARNQQRLSLLERQLANTQAELAAHSTRSQHTDTALHALRTELAALAERTTHMESTAHTPPAAPDLGNAITGLSLDQAELLLILAAQRAQHDGDIPGARELYTQADVILARLPAAEFAELRQTLAAELGALTAWFDRAPARTAMAADDETANPPAAPQVRTWWQRALAGWINIHPTLAPAPPPAEPTTPTRADNPALGSTLQQLRMQRRAASHPEQPAPTH